MVPVLTSERESTPAGYMMAPAYLYQLTKKHLDSVTIQVDAKSAAPTGHEPRAGTPTERRSRGQSSNFRN